MYKTLINSRIVSKNLVLDKKFITEYCREENIVFPKELLEKKYSLEYGENSLSIQKKALHKYISYAIVDDLLATGGTASCVEKMLLSQNKSVTGLSVVVELKELNGKKNLNCDVKSQILL